MRCGITLRLCDDAAFHCLKSGECASWLMNSVDMLFTAGIHLEDVRIHLTTLLLDLSFCRDKCIDFANNV